MSITITRIRERERERKADRSSLLYRNVNTISSRPPNKERVVVLCRFELFILFFPSLEKKVQNPKHLKKTGQTRRRSKFSFFLSALGIPTLSRNTLRERERERESRRNALLKREHIINGGTKRTKGTNYTRIRF